jgi:hypothetical protein
MFLVKLKKKSSKHDVSRGRQNGSAAGTKQLARCAHSIIKAVCVEAQSTSTTNCGPDFKTNGPSTVRQLNHTRTYTSTELFFFETKEYYL